MSDETIRRAGIYSATAAGVTALLGYGAGPGLVFPYPDNGDGPYARVKLNQADAKGKRYRSPLGRGNRLYTPPTMDQVVLQDVNIPLYITEGEKKALKGVQEWLPTVAISGVSSWKQKGPDKKTSVPIPDLNKIAWKGRKVLLVFDSDLVTNPKVRAAEIPLARELASRGAVVWGCRLPAGPNGAKNGLDDYLVAFSVEVFNQLESVLLARPGTRPGLDAGLGDLEMLTAQGWDALMAANHPERLFCHGGVPVRREADPEGRPTLQPLTVDRMRFELAQVANWSITRHTVTRPAPPPVRLCKNLLADPQPPLPLLRRLVPVPVYQATGVPTLAPGYYPDSGILYAPVRDVPLAPLAETESQASGDRVQALQWIDEALADFPFVGPADRAHAIALFLLPYVRDLVVGPTPLHTIEAPSPGTGKTLLVHAAWLPYLGQVVAAMTLGRDEDEMRKRITATLADGGPVIFLDNVRGRVASGTLAAALTAPIWQDRLLGVTQVLRLPNTATWVLTANNPQFSEELARRCLPIRLDARQDRPWLGRTFKHDDLLGWVETHRAELVWAALTLVRVWQLQGRPLAGRRWGMFESWSTVMGGILATAGVEGFLGNLEDFYERADAEGREIRAFIGSWWNQYRDQAVASRELFELGVDADLDLDGKSEQARKVKFGRLLVSLEGRQFSLDPGPAVRVEKEGSKRHGAILWQLNAVPTGESGERLPGDSP